MEWPISPAAFRHLWGLASDGLTIAFFAWVFGLALKGLFPGMLAVLRASLHGWRSVRIAFVDLRIAAATTALERPSVPLARMLFSMFQSIFSLVLLLLVLFTGFVGTYYPARGIFTSLLVGPSALYAPDILGLLLVALVGFVLVTIELNLILAPNKQLAKLRLRKSALQGGSDPSGGGDVSPPESK